MGFGDPDHHHPLTFVSYLHKDVNCFRCDLPLEYGSHCYGCDQCSHYVHRLCFNLSENMIHPLHPEHSLTLFPSPSPHITSDCDQCHEPFHGGYMYSCQECFKFNLHLKCFITLNLKTKHGHPLTLFEDEPTEPLFQALCYCAICGVLIDEFDMYKFSCEECRFSIHFDCTFLPSKVKHHHVHELTFGYNYPEESDLAYCDVCEDKNGKELDRTLSYYYCKACDYIAHVRCVTSKPVEVTTQFDHFIHEHPMVLLRNPIYRALQCAACPRHNQDGGGDDISAYFYFCGICNYSLHKSCVQFPRFIKHPCHEESHTLSLQSRITPPSVASEDICCDFCNQELEHCGWILRCSDCECAVHLSCACDFKHPLYKDTIFTFSSNQETKFRCNGCGELGDGFRMSSRKYRTATKKCYDLHKECFALPGKIEHACHLHPLYLVIYLTNVETYISTTSFQCDICHTEPDPHLWVYCCIQCRYVAHLTCVVSDLLAGGLSCDLSNFFSTAMCEEEKFLVITKQVHCSTLLQKKSKPAFLPDGLFHDPKPPIRDHNGQPITSVVHCPKCDVPISAQAYSSVFDWIHCNLKAIIYSIQTETPADHKPLGLSDEKVSEELTCPICNLLIFPPTYSCADCQIFFHKSCAEIPRKYTVDDGHTLLLQSLPTKSGSLTNCSKCECPFKGYAYICEICEIGFDVTCALGAPLLKLENRNHSFSFSSIQVISRRGCEACGNQFTEKGMQFVCEAPGCTIQLHVECAMLPLMVKVERRIHHHPLVLEPHLDLSVDDYICDVCEKALNPCIWVYRCSDSCGDRATFHVSCIIISNKKKCHFIYDQECSYPHVENPRRYDYLKNNMAVQDIACELVKTPPESQYLFLYPNLFRFVFELEHEYAEIVTAELMEMDQAEVLHLMESPDALKAKVAETMKRLTSILPVEHDEDVGEEKDENEVDTH